MWSNAFSDMAMPRETFDDTKRNELASKLKKPFRKDRIGPATLTDDDFEELAEHVARIAPDLKTPVAMRPFEWFVEIYRRTAEARRQREPALTDQERDRQIISEAEAQVRSRTFEGVLVQGHDWKCPRCLHRNWLTIGALGPTVKCEVCALEDAVPANFSWHFRLDGYVALGLRERGLRGLVWALGALSWRARCSFVFSPPLNIYIDGALKTDADIVCVIDGKLYMGEVKESDRSINDSLAKKLIDLAHCIRPDVVIVACLDPAAQAALTRQTEVIREALQHLNIRVESLLPDAQHGTFARSETLLQSTVLSESHGTQSSAPRGTEVPPVAKPPPPASEPPTARS